MRKHPILGYGKMHKGIDFAAPVGTPVYAAGDGVLEKVGRNGGYGNYIRLRHNSTLKTAYAHLHKFAPGISAGKRVKQGQVIAYIGSTGRSTGPHLHYEILMNGAQVNPNRVDLPVGESLEGEDMKRFKDVVKKINKEYKDRMNGMKFAFSQDKEEDKKKAG
jgi:murein DD-endopeptidase MepM/ murein hydrolase activator NlpD